MFPVFHVLAKKNHALLCQVVDTSSKIRSGEIRQFIRIQIPENSLLSGEILIQQIQQNVKLLGEKFLKLRFDHPWLPGIYKTPGQAESPGHSGNISLFLLVKWPFLCW